jgi:ribosomal protein S18 acetylase RimI-like enzyme
MTTAAIRPARREDGPAMVRLDQVTWAPTVTPGPPVPDDRDMFERREPADHLVAELGGRVVGYIALGHPTPLDSSRHVWEVQGLAVDPDAAGRGIGRALVEAAVEEVRRRGGRKVSLRVLGPNDPARRLYARCGFEVEGTLRGEFLLDGEPVDDVLMAVHLT